jgi:cytochrome c-type biogenesis protein CcmH/NrfG
LIYYKILQKLGKREMVGKIYEQQGNKAKAIEQYEKFLSLWKDADPGITEVEDAKKRLAGLKGQ